jgi:DNA-binding GntR family transcriptional regulator
MAPRKSRDLSQDAQFAEVVNQLANGYKTIGEMVYAVIREAIVGGALPPGEWLRQETLAEAIGVSRIPVRTALLQLESEGLVTFRPHRGAQVRTLSARQIDEIYELRILLETHALRLSMASMTQERLDTLRDLAEALDGEPQGSPFLDLRVRFYRELYAAENHPLLVQMIEELRGHVGRYLLGFRVEHARRHATLVRYLAAGDAPGAESWLRQHLEGVRTGILAIALGEDAAEEPAGRRLARSSAG